MNPTIPDDIPYEERMYTKAYRFQGAFLHPRYWGLWLLIGTLWLIGRLPMAWIVKIGRKIGRLLMKIGGSRVKVTRRNLELCFPELSESEREALLVRNFEAIGVALLEPGVAWFASSRRIRRISRVEGLENIRRHIDKGQGILFCCMHMSCVEMVCRIAAEYLPFNLMYRVHDNPLYEYISNVRRQSYPYKGRYIPRKQVKDLLHFMSKGEMGIILPDQDMGKKRSLFVPFFGQTAATIPSVSDFARLSNARVIMANYYLDENNQYVLSFSQPLENFPSEDNVADTTLINQLIEERIRQHPEQYLWQHRRFKTRPPGEPSLY